MSPPPQVPRAVEPRVVACGGGHGLAASLSALRRLTDQLTAIVTVADDGGSSGRLRAELGVLPPGDLRMALAALADGDEWATTWAEAFQHRFAGTGPLAGHPLGNLVLTGLTTVLDDPVRALAMAGRLLGLPPGTAVLPMSTLPLDIEAEVAGSGRECAAEPARSTVRGQVAVATCSGQVVGVRLVPGEPPAAPESVAAILSADWVVLGPGSWFTSVLPHLLVPGLAKALAATPARVVVVLNLAPQPGETAGFSPEAHLEALVAHAPTLRVDVVLADVDAVVDPRRLVDVAQGLAARVVLAPVAVGDGSPRHEPSRLAAAYAELFSTGAGREDQPADEQAKEPRPWR